MLVGALPNGNHIRSWGYAPSGVAGTPVVIILLVLVLMGRL